MPYNYISTSVWYRRARPKKENEKMTKETTCFDVFEQCMLAVQAG